MPLRSQFNIPLPPRFSIRGSISNVRGSRDSQPTSLRVPGRLCAKVEHPPSKPGRPVFSRSNSLSLYFFTIFSHIGYLLGGGGEYVLPFLAHPDTIIITPWRALACLQPGDSVGFARWTSADQPPPRPPGDGMTAPGRLVPKCISGGHQHGLVRMPAFCSLSTSRGWTTETDRHSNRPPPRCLGLDPSPPEFSKPMGFTSS